MSMEQKKGKKDGDCNRTQCQKPGATWFNHSTRKYYCVDCAYMLNKVNKDWAVDAYGHDLCTSDMDTSIRPVLQTAI